MNKTISFLLILLAGTAAAQIMPITIEPYGGNKRASVSEQIGIVKVEISYNRPGVKGREGKIWGTSVAHYGFVDLGHGTSNGAPWRAGANENTTISFSHPVYIEGHPLPAGKYGFFIALGEKESTLIFSKVNNSWGSFYYDPKEDALRVNVNNRSLDQSVERLKYEFMDQTDSTATIAMQWEKRMIPFTVSVERKKLQMEAFRSDFRTTRPYFDFDEGVFWSMNNSYGMEEALGWADRAISFRVMGRKNFYTLSAKAMLLAKMNRLEDSKKVMEEALPLGTVQEVHSYGRMLLSQKRNDEAFKVFKMNYDKNPNEVFTLVGLARGYSSLGEYKKALPLLKTALGKSPDDINKTNIEAMIKKLEEGKDIN
ncbi:MAG: DUF2911 domain-containing protein [Bacteroidetes bacterium]|nr:DUF2911 domain-containing protein [Bacteroidota bacterium]